MRLLWLTPYLPGPQTFGGQRRLHGLLKALSTRHEIGVLALHNPVDPLDEWMASTQSWCPDAEAFAHRSAALSGGSKRRAQLGGLVRPGSWDFAAHRNDLLAARALQRVREEPWDAVVLELVQMAANVHDLIGLVPVVVDEQNIEFDVQRRTARTAGSLVRRGFNEINWRKLRHDEVGVWRRVDAVAATSERDLAIVHEHVPNVPLALAPNGVDLDEFAPPPGPPDEATVVLFGAHNYFPNTDGLRFLLGEIWPRVLAEMPEARLRVIGHLPPDDLIASAPPSVSIEGFVDDVIGQVGRSSVAIAPLRIGGGTRLKVVEAMALARPVVATTIGAEGLDVRHERDLLVADTPADFAARVVQLLRHPAEAAALGRRGRQRVEEAYGWDACVRPLEDLLGGLHARSPRRG
jgi:hypothetical protein